MKYTYRQEYVPGADTSPNLPKLLSNERIIATIPCRSNYLSYCPPMIILIETAIPFISRIKSK